MAGVLVSGAIGYTVATVAEYGMHRWGGHEARGPLKPLLEKSGRFGGKVSDYLTATYLGHFVIHHVKTSNKNYTTQFAPGPPGDRSTIDAELAVLGKVGQRIKRSDYGMSLSHGGVTVGLLVTLPVHLTLIWVLGLGFLIDPRSDHTVFALRIGIKKPSPLSPQGQGTGNGRAPVHSCACCWQRATRNGFRDHIGLITRAAAATTTWFQVPMFSSAISGSPP